MPSVWVSYINTLHMTPPAPPHSPGCRQRRGEERVQSALQATTDCSVLATQTASTSPTPQGWGGGQAPKESLDCPSTAPQRASQRGERIESGMGEAFQFFAASLWGGQRGVLELKKKKADMKIPEFQLVKKKSDKLPSRTAHGQFSYSLPTPFPSKGPCPWTIKIKIGGTS